MVTLTEDGRASYLSMPISDLNPPPTRGSFGSTAVSSMQMDYLASTGRHSVGRDSIGGIDSVAACSLWPAASSQDGDAHTNNERGHEGLAELRSEAPSAGSPRPSEKTSAARQQVCPTLPMTSSKARDVTVVAAMMRWNFEVRDDGCCTLHAAVRELNSCAKRLKERPCNKDFRPIATMQCTACGVLGDEEEEEEDSNALSETGTLTKFCGTCGANALSPTKKYKVAL